MWIGLSSNIRVSAENKCGDKILVSWDKVYDYVWNKDAGITSGNNEH